MIDQATIQHITDSAQIVDVIQDFMTLKKRGSNFIGNCPFHNEKTPSFSVSPAKGIYKCFGCGEAGNALRFVMKHENLSFTDSLKYLAKKYGIPIVEKELTPEDKQKVLDRDSMLIVNGFAQKFYSNALFNHPEGIALGLSYFKERGFSTSIIEKFQLGYHPNLRDIFTKEALKGGYKIEFLEKTGLTIVKDDYKFDRFFGRVMFPIHSLSGNVIAFGGRVLKTDAKTAKYLNSPESELYHKSNILYGIYHAKSAIIKADKCYMVEGYTDVISMHQSGIENVVASSGTSLTIGQIQLVKRFTPNLTIIYDGDAAGIKASLRGIDLVLEEGLNVKIVSLPIGEDPDSFARAHTPVDFVKYITEHEEDFIRFKTKLLLDDASNDPIKKAQLITEIVRSISKIDDIVIRSVYIKECSKILSVKEEVLYAETGKILKRNSEDQQKKNFYTESKPNLPHQNPLPAFVETILAEKEEHEIIYYLLNFGNEDFKILSSDTTVNETVMTVATYVISELLNEDLELKNVYYKQIFKEYHEKLENNEYVDNKIFLDHTNTEIARLAAEMLSTRYIPSKIWEKHGSSVETPEKTFLKDIPKAITVFKLKIVQAAIEELMSEFKNETVNTDLNNLFDRKKILDSVRMQLASELDRVIIA